ncbi:predicted protein [Chaetoceros tenuissimus]|uniref:Uncharacterized protein n=1 Tax=Chaetoceros tenuissimus TaxID=426638 RepID=A0AAD3CFU5_9STRA|nr:predicted protein [Chaetoceros tenuissimus]
MDFSLRLVKAEKDRNLSNVDSTHSSHYSPNVAYTLWLWAMKQNLSGIQTVEYRSLDHHEYPEGESYIHARDREFAFDSTSLRSQLTILLAKLTPFYTIVQTPKRIFQVEEVYQNYALRNKFTWGLDRFFWRNVKTPVSMAFLHGKMASKD